MARMALMQVKKRALEAMLEGRNGYTSKTLQTEDGQFELDTPRDRTGSFEPQLAKKPLFFWIDKINLPDQRTVY